MTENRYDEQRLAELIRMLPPAPQAWVEAAAARPAMLIAVDHVIALAETDAGFREELIADLESAMQRAGVEPRPEVADAVRSRLSDLK
jgi:hypothetical protein